MKKTIVIGVGGVGGHIASNPGLYGLKDRIIGFLDDELQGQDRAIFGFPILGPISWILDKQEYDVVVAVAFPKIKKKILEIISVNPRLRYPTLLAENSWVSNGCEIGKGAIIYPGACVNYGAKIGDFVVVNMNCAIGHECCIGDFASLAPGVNLAAHCTISKEAEVGIGAATLNGVTIGKGSIIGGQAMAIRDLADGRVAVGVPARVISKVDADDPEKSGLAK